MCGPLHHAPDRLYCGPSVPPASAQRRPFPTHPRNVPALPPEIECGGIEGHGGAGVDGLRPRSIVFGKGRFLTKLRDVDNGFGFSWASTSSASARRKQRCTLDYPSKVRRHR